MNYVESERLVGVGIKLDLAESNTLVILSLSKNGSV